MDWKQAIVEMVLIKQTIDDLDPLHRFEYRLPHVAATEADLRAVEAHLGEPLDPQYRAFLSYAGGWPAFHQTVTLFGPADLRGSALFQQALEMVSYLEERVLEAAQVRRADLLPIAATPVDLDLFVMTRRSSPWPGQVIWFAGDEIDRFPTFTEYYLAMMEYGRLAVQRRRQENEARPPSKERHV